MKIYPGNDTDDSYVEIMLNCQELKTLVSALEKFENKIDQFKTNNKDIKNPGFTHLHLQDCGLIDKNGKSDLVFYVNLNE